MTAWTVKSQTVGRSSGGMSEKMESAGVKAEKRAMADVLYGLLGLSLSLSLSKSHEINNQLGPSMKS